ncbi:hypothetical protein ACKAV7_014740 [Fusarium commune]
MYAPISMILSVGLLASNVVAAPDMNGKCKAHIKQSKANWIDWVEIFDPSGTSIGNSWGDSRYPNGARGSDRLDIALNGKPHRLVIIGPTEEQGKNGKNNNVGLSYAGSYYMAEDCSIGGWDLSLDSRMVYTTQRDMDCYFTC